MITLHLIIFFVKSLFDVLLQLLMCDRCQRGYHVECLGPFYPTEPEGDDDVWVSKIKVTGIISWTEMECTVMILWCSLIMGMILVLLRTFVHSTDKRLDNLNRSDHQSQPFVDSD